VAAATSGWGGGRSGGGGGGDCENGLGGLRFEMDVDVSLD
jgi:hypothetical protein